MQINLRAPGLKECFKYLGWILFFVLLWLNSCSDNKTSVSEVKVKVPEVKGSFAAKKPESKPLEILQTPINETKKDGLVYVENPINKKLLAENERLKADFAKLKSDTLKQKAYDKAIQLNQFSTNFEDDNLLLNINGIVQGEVQEITPSYTIKSKEVGVQVPQKETYLRVFIGTGLGVNTDLDRGLYKFDLSFMNRKGDIFSGEYIRVNGQDFGVISIKKSIINLKR